ncbi:MAG: hypothetical protein PT120_12715 [Aphanizomenon gracile PMC649.10]|nr:hypothetical protein [Aphanizomenon gracile PMC649.10]
MLNKCTCHLSSQTTYSARVLVFISNSSPVIPISESTSRSHDNVVDATKAWENTHPIPKASDELEQINQ